MKVGILEKLQKLVKPGSEELAELIKLTNDLKEIRDTMITMRGLLTDLEFRENYHVENEQLKLYIEVAEEMFPEQMAIVNTAIKVTKVMGGEHGGQEPN